MKPLFRGRYEDVSIAEKEFKKMGSKPVLLVEDDEDLKLTARQLLEMEGYRVLVASNGQEAIEVINIQKNMGDLPGCILLDIAMPVMDGRQFLNHLIRYSPDLLNEISIFIWTATGSPSKDIENLPLQLETVRKPAELSELLDAVTKHCGKP